VDIGVSDFLRELAAGSDMPGRMAAQWDAPGRKAKLAPVPGWLDPGLAQALAERGIGELYSHQAEALELAREGRSFVVATGTASGKSLCYNLPVVHDLLRRKTDRAVYLFPTKALTHDQRRKLGDLLDSMQLRTATYDGDTPAEDRPAVRRHAHIVMTNPDMLHLAILPNHRLWAELLGQLRYVVLDELHTYHGVFGSNVAHVIRRLRRLCAHYGSTPTFIASSATVGNPRELAEHLCGTPFEVVDADGSPSGRKVVTVWNPVLGDDGPEPASVSAHEVASRLVARLVAAGLRTIAFVQSRSAAETLMLRAKGLLAGRGRGLSRKLLAYRGGYLPEERRDIEGKLVTGELLAVVSTSALELGIDIGGLDACVIVGYPGSVSSVWQQAGRVGRTGRDSAVFLVPFEGTVDQYIARHPELLSTELVERATSDPGNRFILGSHLLCAAKELPLAEGDIGEYWPDCPEPEELLGRLADAGYVEHRTRWYAAPGLEPAADVSLRSSSGRAFEIIHAEGGGLVGTVGAATALYYLHPEAIYLHQGEKYIVRELDRANRRAVVGPSEATYTTRPRIGVGASVDRELDTVAIGGARLVFAEMTMTTRLVGYSAIPDMGRGQTRETQLEIDPETMETVGFLLCFGQQVVSRLSGLARDPLGSLHAFEHAAVAVMPLLCSCGRHDMMGYSTLLDSHAQGPVVCLLDNHPGGVGLAEAAFERFQELLRLVGRAVRECPCEDGCPGCVQSPSCGSNNRPLDKVGALEVLGGLCAHTPSATM